MVMYTGLVTLGILIAAALWAALLHELPGLLPEGSSSTLLAVRLILLVFFTILIFMVGVLTNRRKVRRAGFKGTPFEGAPNTIFFIPLQYWAFVYLVLIGTAIFSWTNQEARPPASNAPMLQM